MDLWTWPLNIYDDSKFWRPSKQESHGDFIYNYIYMHIYIYIYKNAYMFFPLILIGTSNGILVALKKHTARLKKENADFGVHNYVLLTYCLSVDSTGPWQKRGVAL